ncbi:MAG: alpha/beta fold hydrolase [Hyphomonadaceae bacterium]|jgi:3-oxoadipate enol-lactonase|nr:alpha/beta fold hydrolase [Hyphomonadaceae bacterium]
MQATINGMRMTYAVEGPDTATPIVLHHSLATNLTLWDELTAALIPRYRVVRFDARGHGTSEPTKAPYDFETLSADVVGLMDHLKIGRAHFLGLSMGGMVGQYLGLLHPQRFLSLTLSSTSSRVPPEGQALWAQRVKNTRERGIETQVEVAMPRWVTAANQKAKPAVVERLAGMIRATPAEGFCGWGEAIRTLNVTDRLPAITLPTTVIVGAEDPGTPPAAAEAIHRQIKGSHLIVVPGVSHMLCAEAPAVFNGHVLAFLDQQAGH